MKIKKIIPTSTFVIGVVTLFLALASLLGVMWFYKVHLVSYNQSSAASEVEQFTKSLTTINLQASAPNRSSNLQSTARQREQAYIQLMTTSPAEAIRVAMPAPTRDQMAAEIQPLIERRVSVEGVFLSSHTDLKQGRSVPEQAILQDNGTFFIIHGGGNRGRTGARVRASGVILDNHMAVDGQLSVITPAPTYAEGEDTHAHNKGAVLGSAIGVKRVAVVLFNYKDNATTPDPAFDNIRQTLFTDSTKSANAYYKETSYGKVSLTSADVFGPYTFPYNGNSSTCDRYATNATGAPTINANNYDLVVYAYKVPNCGYSVGYAGSVGTSIGGKLSFVYVPDPYAFIHELNHNLGIDHSNTSYCTSNGKATSVFTQSSSECSSTESGDPFDVMGTRFFPPGHVNGYQKLSSGWLSGVNGKRVAAGTAVKERVYALEQLASSPQVLVVPIQDSTSKNYYYLEYRRPSSFDAFSTSDPVTQGVSIRIAGDYTLPGQKTYLVDTSPDNNFTDSSLKTGQIFTDTAHGITIRTTAVTAQYAEVEITSPGSLARPTIGNPVSSASFLPAIAPGALLSIFGTDMTSDSCAQSASTVPLPTTLCGTRVLIGYSSIPAPLLYVSPTQINFQLPFGIELSNSLIVQASKAGSTSNSYLSFFTATPTAPAIFTQNSSGKGLGTIQLNRSGYPFVGATPTTAAISGEVIIVYASGLGVSAPAVETGKLPTTLSNVTKPTVIINGFSLPATAISFAGKQPSSVGQDQVNIVLPSTLTTQLNLPTGVTTTKMKFCYGNVCSNEVDLPIKK